MVRVSLTALTGGSGRWKNCGIKIQYIQIAIIDSNHFSFNIITWCIFCRKIVIAADAFDSKAKFLAKTRSAFGGGTFNLNDQFIGRLAKYYMFLKNQYHNSLRINNVHFSNDYVAMASLLQCNLVSPRSFILVRKCVF